MQRPAYTRVTRENVCMCGPEFQICPGTTLPHAEFSFSNMITQIWGELKNDKPPWWRHDSATSVNVAILVPGNRPETYTAFTHSPFCRACSENASSGAHTTIGPEFVPRDIVHENGLRRLQ